MATDAAKVAVLAVLRRSGQWMRSAEIADLIGCSARKLTGTTCAVLFLLEWEGLVERTGRTKGTRWRAT